MKISFSTVGCPDWSWHEIFATAKDFHFDGIEIRGIESQIYAPKAQPFLDKNLAATKSELKAANLVIPNLCTSACIGTEDAKERMAEARDYIDLAAKLESPYVRVMVSPLPEPVPINAAGAIARLTELCEYAAAKNVCVLVETNGIYADSYVLSALMQQMDNSHVGVLWDLHHPYRFFGEMPEVTYGNLAPYIRHVHVKDSIKKDDKIIYRLMGYGDLPVFDALSLLDKGGYGGFVSLEWVKRWNPDLQEPGIVFAHYQNYIRHLLSQLL